MTIVFLSSLSPRYIARMDEPQPPDAEEPPGPPHPADPFALFVTPDGPAPLENWTLSERRQSTLADKKYMIVCGFAWISECSIVLN